MCWPPQTWITPTAPSVTLLSMDWNHPPRRVRPPQRHGSFTSSTPPSLPSFYSNPMSYPPLSEVSFSHLGAAAGSMFPNPSRRFLWLTKTGLLLWFQVSWLTKVKAQEPEDSKKVKRSVDSELLPHGTVHNSVLWKLTNYLPQIRLQLTIICRQIFWWLFSCLIDSLFDIFNWRNDWNGT